MPDLQALLAATASRPAQLLSVKLAERPPSSHCNIENQPFNESSPMEGVGNDAQFELKKRKLWTRLHSALQRAIDDLARLGMQR
ncbi:hypothetical protein WJX72_012546 [[Myrmecia] bisecta]|uniref:Uncharacterized protein n=1 Tax=[Myrmecia] bisecta TaxID=41462 RepID=A0AAW1R9Q4_9CHLO